MKNQQWNLIILLLLATFTSKIQAQQTFSNKVKQSFLHLFDKNPQEKVYLHMDKTTYATGDNIWFKAYLTDATYHVPNLLSKFIYVELIDRQDSVKQRIKLKQTDSCFYGNLTLPINILPGDYNIRAYTNWMQNNDEDFFFKKNIKIINTANDLNIHTVNRVQENTVTTILTLVDNTGKPYAKQRVGTILKHGATIVKKSNEQSDAQGNIAISHALTDSIDRMAFSFPYDLPFKYSDILYLPDFSMDFDLQFFPEGGNLLAGETQIVAFKTVDANGLSAEVEGNIYNQRGEVVAPFKSTHRGMGTVTLSTKSGEQYHAIAKIKNGKEKKITLPLPSTEGYALQTVRQENNSIHLSIHKGTASTHQGQLYIIIESRGRLIAIIPADENFIGELKPEQFEAGITHLILADEASNIYSERLCFIPPKHPSQTRLRTDKEQYGRREKVAVSLEIKDGNGQPKRGSFSFAVTDNNMVAPDSTAENMISYFLLNSDLKGHIEAPGTYINESPAHIDLLMLTHGWTRFNIGTILQKQDIPTEYSLELNQQLKGRVTNYGDKIMANASVQIFAPALGLLGGVQANNQGVFTISNIDFPDSTLFLIRGFKLKGGKHVELYINEPLFKQPKSYFPESFRIEPETREKFLDRFKGNYYYQDGVKVYMLDEVNIIRHQSSREKQKYTGEYTDMADQILGQDELSKYAANSIFQLLMRLPGVMVSGENVTIRAGGTPLFLVDGIPMEADFVSSILPDDVDNVGVIKDGARLSFFGTRGSQGVIIINTKRGAIHDKPTPGLIKYRPLGYLKPDEFYMPEYDLPSVKNNPVIDYRSTIYWNPCITTDRNGQAAFSFFTADLNTTYTLTIEGIDQDGELYRQIKTIRRE